ncbi:MAG TPA: hypothetical protein VF459_07140 [Caulobacteraceae bacterium]
MVTQVLGTRPREVGRRFYLAQSIVMALIIVAGFSQTVPNDLVPPGLPILLQAHGLVFAAWLVIIILQPALITGGNVRLHRKVGLLGAAIAAAMVVMGLAATWFAIRYHRVPTFFPPTIFLVMNSLGILVFGSLVASAIALRRRSDWHKRLMICATAAILGPGLGRFLPMDSFGAAAPLVLFAINDAVLLAGPVADLVVLRRVHPAYFWGAGAVLLMQPAIPLIAFSPLGHAMLQVVKG